MTCLFSSEPTPQKVYEYCIQQDILYPEIVTAQAIWETGWFNCDNCSLDKNNLFGFTTGGPYLEFEDWKSSIDYYKYWQDKFYDGERNYYDFLSCIYKTNTNRCIKYCTDPEKYVQCLQKTIERHKNDWINN